MLYKVSTAEKKNVFIRTECRVMSEGVAADKTFFMNEWYRWGHCYIEIEDGEDPPAASNAPYEQPFELDNYNVTDQESDDGCSLLFEFGDDWTEEEKQYIEDLWECGDYWDVVETWDAYTDYYGPLDIELIEE